MPWNRSFLPRLCASCLAVAMSLAATLTSAFADEPLQYNRDVRPILADTCFTCHGPDSAARKADLRLDQRDKAIESGALSPGKPEESEMIRRLFSDDPDEQMPPPASHKTLTAGQKETLCRWVAEGAVYQPHWSFIAPVRPELPSVKRAEWVKTAIDAFILARLEAAGLAPAPEADRRTLARRVSLDLTGLPPAPTDVDAFVNDQSPNAYERYVDQTLRSPHWGEHRGRYWLDVARYADTHGIHFDNFREMWAYRDWVINAFNRNLSFDQFTIEQLAGDLLPNATFDQRVASGFNRCNITTNEGGIIDEEYLVLYTRDRTETVSQVWLGLTAGCAVCHSHKYDPLTQREFYEMAAYFNNTTQAAKDGNIKDTPPTLTVPREEDRSRWNELQTQVAEARKSVEARKAEARADFDTWLASASLSDAPDVGPSDGLALHAPFDEGAGTTLHVSKAGDVQELAMPADLAWEAGAWGESALKIRPDDAIEFADAGDFDTHQGFSYGAWVKLTSDVGGAAMFARMNDQQAYRGWDLWIENNRIGCHIINAWPDDALKVVSRPAIKVGAWTHVFVTYDGSARAEGVKVYINGKPQPLQTQANALKGAIRTEVPLKIAQRNTAQRAQGLVLQDLRLYSRSLTGDEVSQLAKAPQIRKLLAKPAEKRSAADRDSLFAWWLPAIDKSYQEQSARLAALEGEQTAIQVRGTIAHVMQERPDAAMAHILFRGEYDKRRDQVTPSTPEFLPDLPEGAPNNRLGFARWLLRPEHPLTARVTVNRFWQEVFGTGLVRTAGDFGVAGELPSHPELVDWLAVDFRESGWDIKRFFKLIVMSAAYRQAAIATPEKLAVDPENRLLSRGPRYRMDAEMVRDYALAASGQLVRKLGGPSVKPYQPDGVWEAVAIIGSNTRDYQRDSGESLYRRSLYTFWKRSAPPASMEIFNAPSREFCVVRRERTDTPLQALVTLNDDQFIEAARNLAQLAVQTGGDSDETRIDLVAQRLLARSFRPDELKVVQASLADLQSYYASKPDDAAKLVAVGESKANPAIDVPTLAAWTMLANQLMNLDEVLNK